MCEYYSFCKVMNNKSTACVCNQACPLNYEPVCGSDGRTYANECVMKSEACNNQKMIIVKHQGTCKRKLEELAMFYVRFRKVSREDFYVLALVLPLCYT